MNYERLRGLTAMTAFLAGLSFVTSSAPARAAAPCVISSSTKGTCVEGIAGTLTLNQTDVRGLRVAFDLYLWDIKPDEELHFSSEPSFCLAKAATGCDVAVSVPGRVLRDTVTSPGYTYIPGKQPDHAVDTTAKRHVEIAVSDTGTLTVSVRFTDNGPLVPIVKNPNVTRLSTPIKVSWAATANGSKVTHTTSGSLAGESDAFMQLKPTGNGPVKLPEECSEGCSISINDGYMVVTGPNP
ncbi:hypothetical protein [Nonomuraea sediminis]|uniref:hypothetical protein n=1 Tax=Nonomuraea sediminis TaxID=2835864 RepID=UPI001BDBF9D7|nr:hypothetical protein [Nonomuraea sediminis]